MTAACSDYADPPGSLLSPPCTFRQQSLPRPEKRPNPRAPSKPAGLQVQTKRAGACHVPRRRDQTTTGHDQTFRNIEAISLADGSSTPPRRGRGSMRSSGRAALPLVKCADQNNGRQPAVGSHTGAAGIPRGPDRVQQTRYARVLILIRQPLTRRTCILQMVGF
jgi:hypothetical protein